MLFGNTRFWTIIVLFILGITQEIFASPIRRDLWNDLGLGDLFHHNQQVAERPESSSSADASSAGPSASPIVVTITKIFTETIDALATTGIPADGPSENDISTTPSATVPPVEATSGVTDSNVSINAEVYFYALTLVAAANRLSLPVLQP